MAALGRFLVGALNILVPIVVAFAAFAAAESRLQTVLVAGLVLIYVGVRTSFMIIVHYVLWCALNAQTQFTGLALKLNYPDMDELYSSLETVKRGQARLQQQEMTEGLALALLGIYSLFAVVQGL